MLLPNTFNVIESIGSNVLSKRVQIISSKSESSINSPEIRPLNRQISNDTIYSTNSRLHGIKVKNI